MGRVEFGWGFLRDGRAELLEITPAKDAEAASDRGSVRRNDEALVGTPCGRRELEGSRGDWKALRRKKARDGVRLGELGLGIAQTRPNGSGLSGARPGVEAA